MRVITPRNYQTPKIIDHSADGRVGGDDQVAELLCNEQLLTDLGSVSDLPVSGLQTPDYLHLVVDNDAGNWAA